MANKTWVWLPPYAWDLVYGEYTLCIYLCRYADTQRYVALPKSHGKPHRRGLGKPSAHVISKHVRTHLRLTALALLERVLAPRQKIF
jgi:hypothetical protein